MRGAKAQLTIALTVALLAALASGCGGGGASREASATLEPIASVDRFQRAFDADRGTARLVILLSPT